MANWYRCSPTPPRKQLILTRLGVRKRLSRRTAFFLIHNSQCTHHPHTYSLLLTLLPRGRLCTFYAKSTKKPWPCGFEGGEKGAMAETPACAQVTWSAFPSAITPFPPLSPQNPTAVNALPNVLNFPRRKTFTATQLNVPRRERTIPATIAHPQHTTPATQYYADCNSIHTTRAVTTLFRGVTLVEQQRLLLPRNSKALRSSISYVRGLGLL